VTPHFDAVSEALRVVLDFQSIDRFTPETQLETDLGLDSGLMLELLMQLEETVPGLQIEQGALSHDQFRTIGTVCDYVSGRLAARIPA
jgi:acyl carrier protein